MKRYFFLTLIAVFTFAACSTSSPDHLLDEETYIKLFIELAVLDQYDPLLLEQKQKEQLQEQILESYGVTFEEFRDSHDYYEKSLQDQIRRTERATQLLRAERDSIHHYENDYRNQKRLEELARQEAEENQSSDN